MAAALRCEICGGKLVGKPGGVFECDSCGMEYSTEWARQKIQEIRGTVKVEGTVEVTGKVQVEGGTVNVEGTATKESLLKRAKMCYADGDREKAGVLLEQVLNADPECAEAYLYRAAMKLNCDTLEKLREKYEDINNDVVFSHPDVEKASQFATGELKQTLLGWKQARESAISLDNAKREENRLTFPALRRRTEKLSQMFSAGEYHTVGLKADGTLVAAGDNSSGQCDVSGWRDIVAISAGLNHTVGLKADGTVVAVGWNNDGQCNVSSWRDIVAISAGKHHTVGLKVDGTVVAVGSNYYSRCNVSGWKDIVAISAGDCHTLGLKADGTLVAVGDNRNGRCNVSGWRLFQNIETIEAERAEARKRQEEEARKQEEQRRAERKAALEREKRALETELSSLKGLFTGKRRREIEASLAQIKDKLKAFN